MGTLVNSIEEDSIMVPRRESIEESVIWLADGFDCNSELGVGDGARALETSFFSKRPAWMSSMTFNSDATRDVYPANSVTSLYENIIRPTASEDDSSMRRFVTKPVIISKAE